MTKKRDSKGRFLSKMGKPKYYKLLEYTFKGYEVSIKNVLRSMSVKEIEALFKATNLLTRIIEDVLNEFEREFMTWDGSISEWNSEDTAILKEKVLSSLKELMKEI